MKKHLIIFGLLMIIASPVQAIDYSKDGFPPLQPEIRQEYFRELADAEQYVFGRTYEKQCIGIRLNKLEKELFRTTYPRKSESDRIKLILANYGKYNPEIAGLDKLEKKVFARTFENDTTENRITRLEEQVIGTIQDGDLNSRYNKLAEIMPRYNRTKYINPVPYCAIPNTFSKQGLLRAFSNFFIPNTYSGYPTGWTPQIVSPYVPSYAPPYSRGFANNRGWNDAGIYRGSNIGVHILD